MADDYLFSPISALDWEQEGWNEIARNRKGLFSDPGLANTELKPYNPSLRDRLGAWLTDVAGKHLVPTDQQYLAEGLVGSSGTGWSKNGMGLVDFSPLAIPFWIDEYKSAQDANRARAESGELPTWEGGMQEFTSGLDLATLGVGGKVVKPAERMANRLLKPGVRATEKEAAALAEFIGDNPYGNSLTINPLLRSGDPIANIDMLESMDSLFTKAPRTVETTTVYRGMPAEIDPVGQDNAFLSTTRDPNVAAEFAENLPEGGKVIEIEVPAGTQHINTSEFQQEGMRYQQEMLLPRNGRLEEIPGQPGRYRYVQMGTDDLAKKAEADLSDFEERATAAATRLAADPVKLDRSALKETFGLLATGKADQVQRGGQWMYLVNARDGRFNWDVLKSDTTPVRAFTDYHDAVDSLNKSVELNQWGDPVFGSVERFELPEGTPFVRLDQFDRSAKSSIVIPPMKSRSVNQSGLTDIVTYEPISIEEIERLSPNGLPDVAPGAFRTWHGTPHTFPAERLVAYEDGTFDFITGEIDKLPDVPPGATAIKDFPYGRPRMDKMGSGEGAQAFGPGFYTGERRSTGEWYKKQLQRKAQERYTYSLDDTMAGPVEMEFGDLVQMYSNDHYDTIAEDIVGMALDGRHGYGSGKKLTVEEQQDLLDELQAEFEISDLDHPDPNDPDYRGQMIDRIIDLQFENRAEHWLEQINDVFLDHLNKGTKPPSAEELARQFKASIDDGSFSSFDGALIRSAYDFLESYDIKKIAGSKARLNAVDIHADPEEDFIRYEFPFGQQSKKVKEAIARIPEVKEIAFDPEPYLKNWEESYYSLEELLNDHVPGPEAAQIQTAIDEAAGAARQYAGLMYNKESVRSEKMADLFKGDGFTPNEEWNKFLDQVNMHVRKLINDSPAGGTLQGDEMISKANEFINTNVDLATRYAKSGMMKDPWDHRIDITAAHNNPYDGVPLGNLLFRKMREAGMKDAEIMQHLSEEGIVGTRFEDGFTRHKTNKKTYNYSTFDEAVFDIVKRYGLILPAGYGTYKGMTRNKGDDNG